MKMNRRFLLTVIVAVTPFSETAGQPWFTHQIVGMEVGPTGRAVRVQ
jgi:hypothetical protein